MFPNTGQSRERCFRFYQSDFDNYDIKRDRWYNPIDGYTFEPAIQTLNDIDDVHKTYYYPTFPTSKERPPCLPPRKRAICEDFVQLSPPRRNRRRIQEDVEPTNDDPDQLCDEVN